MSDLSPKPQRNNNTDLANLTKQESRELERTVRFTVDMPQSMHHQFKIQAATENRTMKDVILDALEAYLERA